MNCGELQERIFAFLKYRGDLGCGTPHQYQTACHADTNSMASGLVLMGLCLARANGAGILKRRLIGVLQGWIYLEILFREFYVNLA